MINNNSMRLHYTYHWASEPTSYFHFSWSASMAVITLYFKSSYFTEEMCYLKPFSTPFIFSDTTLKWGIYYIVFI